MLVFARFFLTADLTGVCDGVAGDDGDDADDVKSVVEDEELVVDERRLGTVCLGCAIPLGTHTPVPTATVVLATPRSSLT